MDGSLIAAVSFAYLLLLFAIAWIGDRRAEQGRSLITNPLTYALSIAVFHTSWTFYGSVGRAASTGIGYLPIYLGPTLMAALSAVVLSKMVRIDKTHRITSIADFISARYGKSALIGGLVTVIAVVGIMPYISLQLKAVSDTFTVLIAWPDIDAAPAQVMGDTVLLVALILAVFAILFGARHIDASEHHEGMVLAIAFESVVKLAAFLAVGVFVTYSLFNGFGDVFTQAAAVPAIRKLFTSPSPGFWGDWVGLTALAMFAIVCLPRQFQVSVIENVDERHVARAIWLFPLYMFLINLFVLPIALAGRLLFGQAVNPDLFVLALPLANGSHWLAVFAFIGGLSAAASMVIVETVAISTMVCNDLVMPVLLRIRPLGLAERADLSQLLLSIRRGTIVVVVLLGYTYVRLIGESYALATIGLVSFCAAAQFAPALIGGVLWKGANAKGAMTGLFAGFLVWLYTLLLPSLARSGFIPLAFVDSGIFGIDLLKPYALFGLGGMEPVTHALVWSLMANLGAYITVSLLTNQSAIERIQAELFVDALRPTSGERTPQTFWRGTAGVEDLLTLTARFVGRDRALRIFEEWAAGRGGTLKDFREADSQLVGMAETLLAGAVGTASARVMVSSVTKGEVVGLDEVMDILDEASQVIAYSQKLEAATAELKQANERLKELDRLKDDFMSTVTHELRTPLTSIRSFSEILFDNPALDESQRQNFLSIIIKESERLTRLINQVLDVAKIESGRMQWHWSEADPAEVMAEAAAATHSLFEDKGIKLETKLAAMAPIVTDRDKLMQVVINLLSNAVKFAPADTGRVELMLEEATGGLQVTVTDNGPGIPDWARKKVFDKFQQVGDTMTAKPQGTGLGLTISKSIVERLGGGIWVGGKEGQGAVFGFYIPRLSAPPQGCEAVGYGA